MIVIDASLATKLVICEDDTEQARRWYLELQREAVAPDLIVVEVAQAIVRRVNARDATLDGGRVALRAWRDILDGGGITLFDSRPAQVEAAAELAMSIGHPVKDCLYLTLAIELGGELATCDAKFAAKAKAQHPGVRLLSDYAI